MGDRMGDQMTGQDLYEKYVELYVEINQCGCDDWEDLDEDEQCVWNALVEKNCNGQ